MADWKIKGIFKADADKVYKEISELSEVTPQQVYERGKDPESELHKCFEWDNDVCAEFTLTGSAVGVQSLILAF